MTDEERMEFDNERRLRERLASLLERTANKVKGKPPDDVLWDWSDLPSDAHRLRRIADLALEVRPFLSMVPLPTERKVALMHLLDEEKVARASRTAKAILTEEDLPDDPHAEPEGWKDKIAAFEAKVGADAEVGPGFWLLQNLAAAAAKDEKPTFAISLNMARAILAEMERLRGGRGDDGP